MSAESVKSESARRRSEPLLKAGRHRPNPNSKRVSSTLTRALAARAAGFVRRQWPGDAAAAGPYLSRPRDWPPSPTCRGISVFYGIVIEMYFGDHPPPHFRARCGGDAAKIDIASGEVIAGTLPGRALRLV
jgi:Domain of unknown function (DUF4160)